MSGITKAIEKAKKRGPFLDDLLQRSGLAENTLPNPKEMPVRVCAEKNPALPKVGWTFERDSLGIWSVVGPREVLEFYADLVQHRKEIFYREPTTNLASLPRLVGDTADRIISWEGSMSTNHHSSFLSQIMQRLRVKNTKVIAVESRMHGRTFDAELALLIENWAATLKANGVKVGDQVPIRLNRGTEFVAVMIAILAIGATVVPMEPLIPEAKELEILELLNARVGIADKQFRKMRNDILWLSSAQKCTAVSNIFGDFPELPDDHIAFILFTSGSTGRPKGIQLTHENFNQYFDTVADEIHPEAFRRSAWTSSVAFDSSIAEIIYPLIHGGTIVAFDQEELISIPSFVKACTSKKITGVGCSTALWSAWMKLASTVPNPMPESIRHVDIGGSAAELEDVATWLRIANENCCLMNRYGPTETTETVTAFRINADSVIEGEVPIGRPERGTEIRVLDSIGRRIAPGQQGEIWVGGGQVALGYLGLDDAKRGFELPPNAEGRWYRTGDKATWSFNGDLLFRGRADNQVKISGHRVELEEVRQAIERVAAGRIFTVLAPTFKFGLEIVVVLEKLESGGHDDDWIFRVKQALASQLPRYAVPRKWRVVKELPRTPSGKIDQMSALELLATENSNLSEPLDVGTRDWVIEKVREVLGYSNIDLSRSFFDLGGDSLSAMLLHACLESACERPIPKTLVHISSDINDLIIRYENATQSLPHNNIANRHRCEILIKENDSPEVMFMPGLDGSTDLGHLGSRLGTDMSISAIDLDLSQSLQTIENNALNASFDSLVKDLTDIVLSRPPTVLPILVGYSIGGWIAFGIASECRRRGVELPPPLMIEPGFHVRLSKWGHLRQWAYTLLDRVVNVNILIHRIRLWLKSNINSTHSAPPHVYSSGRQHSERIEFERLLSNSLSCYKPRPADIAITLVTRHRGNRRFAAWSRLARGGVLYERVQLREHTDYAKADGEDIVLELIRGHVSKNSDQSKK
jgi:amino acid adenylation domain-containing protein